MKTPTCSPLSRALTVAPLVVTIAAPSSITNGRLRSRAAMIPNVV